MFSVCDSLNWPWLKVVALPFRDELCLNVMRQIQRAIPFKLEPASTWSFTKLFRLHKFSSLVQTITHIFISFENLNKWPMLCTECRMPLLDIVTKKKVSKGLQTWRWEKFWKWLSFLVLNCLWSRYIFFRLTPQLASSHCRIGCLTQSLHPQGLG